MRINMTCAAFVVANLMLANGAVAGASGEADWPCIQRHAQDLSVALMWPHPVPQVSLTAAAREQVAVLALRRVTLDEATRYVERFVTEEPGVDADLLGNVFVGVFDRLNADRKRLLQGIAVYARTQAALTGRIAATRSEMATLLAADAPDHDRIDQLEQQLDWDERIFLDRERALSYVCETPVLIEKRAFAIAQILLAALPAP